MIAISTLCLKMSFHFKLLIGRVSSSGRSPGQDCLEEFLLQNASQTLVTLFFQDENWCSMAPVCCKAIIFYMENNNKAVFYSRGRISLRIRRTELRTCPARYSIHWPHVVLGVCKYWNIEISRLCKIYKWPPENFKSHLWLALFLMDKAALGLALALYWYCCKSLDCTGLQFLKGRNEGIR